MKLDKKSVIIGVVTGLAIGVAIAERNKIAEAFKKLVSRIRK